MFFVSGSPTYLVRMMGEVYGIDDCKGTEYLFDENGYFSGQIVQMWDSDSKTKAINELIEKYDIDVDKSYAYGDTNGDFSMLKTMYNAIAINPSNKFLEMIREDEDLSKRAKIIVERKDVIYNLDVNVDHYSVKE